MRAIVACAVIGGLVVVLFLKSIDDDNDRMQQQINRVTLGMYR